MLRQITNVDKLNDKRKTHQVQPNGRGFWVTSGSSGERYYVRLEPQPSCTCKWAQHQSPNAPVACSHVQAAAAHVAREEGYRVKARNAEADTSHLHRRELVLGNGVKLTLRRLS